MKLQTPLTIPKPSFHIDHESRIFSIGSCFASEMAAYFKTNKFQIKSNPFGVIYNANSIENSLLRLYSREYYNAEELFEYQGVYHSWDHHSQWSDVSREKMLVNINNEIDDAADFLRNAHCVIITLGSSFYYELKKLELLVANCHKVPNTYFNKKLLSVEDTKMALLNTFNMIEDMSSTSPNFIVTLSPVVHLKDGLIENRRSKSIALEALHQVVEVNKNAYYFPAFEIVQDELRNYRFYNEAMTHPSFPTQKYIWKRFGETFFSEKTQCINREIQSIETQRNHRAFQPQSEAHQKGQENLQRKIKEFNKNNPHISL